MAYSKQDRAYTTAIPFDEIIHRMRLLTGSSFRMVSDAMGPGHASISQLYRIEQGTKHLPDKPVLERLEHYFKFPPNFLYHLWEDHLWEESSGQHSSRRAEWYASSFFRNILVEENESSLLIAKLIYGMEWFTADEAQRLVNLISDTDGRERQRRHMEEHRSAIRERQRRHRLEEEFPDIDAIVNVGYDIWNVQLTDDQLRIRINEPQKVLHMEDVLSDYRQVVQSLPYGINLTFDYEPNTVILSPEPEEGKRDGKRSMRFLQRVNYALQPHTADNF